MRVWTNLSIAVAVAILSGLAGCGVGRKGDGLQPSTLPSPPPPPGTTGFTFSGSVIGFSESGATEPVPNLRLRVRTGGPGDSVLDGVDLPDVVTAANGRYEIHSVTSPMLFVTAAPGAGHRFLCDWYPLSFRSAGGFHGQNLPVVPASWAGARPPSGMWLPGTSVHGIVSERVNGVLQPVGGAVVAIENGRHDPPATTTAAGFYMICSDVGSDQYRAITARKDGYLTTTDRIFGGWDYRMDFEIGR